ncbi:MAG: VOC family protein [Chloroflexota bacterium]|nr:VOC family protein [Chloroflexota bacterium]
MRLTHVRLLVADYPTCFRFYRDVMGFPVAWGDENGPYADFRAGEAMLALYDRRLMAEAVGTDDRPLTANAMDRCALIFAVESVDGDFDALRSRGVVFETDPQDRPAWGIRTAHFRDPDGNLLEIYTELSP